MDEDSILFRAGFLLLLVIALVGGAAHLLMGGPSAAPARAAAVVPAPGGEAAGARPAPAAAEPCRVAGELRSLPADVHESSGVAASRRHPGVLWTHNDSGDPVLYAVGADGAPRGRVRVEGAELRDWEDLALGPCPDGECLYVADIGDNAAERPFVTVYRVPEPAPGDARTRPAEALHARYPDGPQDAEALFVLPGREIYLVTKGETGPIALYRFPEGARPGQTARLERVRELAAGPADRGERVTGAAAGPDGEWIAVRTVDALSLYRAPELLGGAGRPAQRVELAPLGEAQGEGVAFGGGGLFLTSEGGGKESPATLARLECALR